MALPQPINRRYTYEEYYSWDDNQRWEIIDGYVFSMSPNPNTNHQTIVGNLCWFLAANLEGKPCTPILSPFDVVLSDYDVVQPDFIVVCDKTKITELCLRGAPDLVFEILSSYSVYRDCVLKKDLYERSGVKEYIIIDNEIRTVERYLLKDDGIYGAAEVFSSSQEIPLKTLPDLILPLSVIFEGVRQWPQDNPAV